MDDKVKYLLSLSAVRERAQIVGEAAEAGKLSHFDVHEERLDEAAEFVTSVIKVCFFHKISTSPDLRNTDGRFHSATLDQTSSTPFPRTADGNTLKSATCPASPNFWRNGNRVGAMNWRLLAV